MYDKFLNNSLFSRRKPLEETARPLSNIDFCTGSILRSAHIYCESMNMASRYSVRPDVPTAVEDVTIALKFVERSRKLLTAPAFNPIIENNEINETMENNEQ